MSVTPFNNLESIGRDLKEASDKAFTEIFLDLYRPLVEYGTAFIQDEAEAADITTEAFLKFWDRQQNFNNIHEIRSFLYTSVTNACKNYLAKNKVIKTYKEWHQRCLELAERDNHFLFLIFNAEASKAFDDHIASLPKQAGIAFRDFYEGVPTEETAAKMGMGQQIVRNYRSRAVKILRKRIDKTWLSLAD